MIKELSNPLTEEYLTFKKLVLSPDFSWYWQPDAVSDEEGNAHKNPIPFFGHAIIKRPLDYPDYLIYPKPNSPYVDISTHIIAQILHYNKIEINCIFRLNVNLTLPVSEKGCKTLPHVDHNFPHKNLLIYLNNTDGNTISCDENGDELEYSLPEEDKIILFENTHYHYLPTLSRRVVIVCTYM